MIAFATLSMEQLVAESTLNAGALWGRTLYHFWLKILTATTGNSTQANVLE
jgi:hypothetical protein